MIVRAVTARRRLGVGVCFALLVPLAGGAFVVACVDDSSNPLAPTLPDASYPDSPGTDDVSPQGRDAVSNQDAGTVDSTVDDSSARDATADQDASNLDATADQDASNLDATADAAADGGLAFPLQRISPAHAGGSPNSNCYFTGSGPSGAMISQDGRYVALACTATDLTADAASPASVMRFFVRDTVANTTEQVSVLPDGGDLYNPYTSGVSVAMSGDGRHVVFVVPAQNWDPVTYSGNNSGVFIVRDRTAGTSTLVGKTTGGTLYSGSNLGLSNDGRYLVFVGPDTLAPLPSAATYEQVWVRDLTGNGDALTIASTTDGPLVAGFDGGAQPAATSFIVNGLPNSSSISSDGGVVAFTSGSYNMEPNAVEMDAGAVSSFPHCFVRNLGAGTTTRIDVALSGATTWPDGACYAPIISGDGAHVIFFSEATNLIANDTNGLGDIFVRDLVAGTTERVSVADDGSQLTANLPVIYPDYGFSSDGSIVVMGGRNKAMVPNDNSTANREVFVRDRTTKHTLRASFLPDGSELVSGMDTWVPTVSGDGSYIVFLGSGAGFPPDKTISVYEAFGVARSAAR